jgi:muramoyltetrapeptide carboxypeptidase
MAHAHPGPHRRRLVRRAAKLLIGYSDITALHALWARQGLASLHAPMAASDLLLPGQGDREAFFGLLRQGCWPASAGARAGPQRACLCRPGVAEGPLIGGNLSLVAALLGTPWAWDARGAILFLEDVNEEPYRVDRLLTQLRLAGVLDAAAGFVLGSFTEEASPTGLLQQMLGGLGKPVLAGWPSGHGTPNRPLPLGLRVRLDAQAGSLTLLQDFLRTQLPAGAARKIAGLQPAAADFHPPMPLLHRPRSAPLALLSPSTPPCAACPCWRAARCATTTPWAATAC